MGLAYLALCLWDPVTAPGPTLCLARLALALPCPLCGATRGVALCLRGRPLEASAYHPLAAVFALGGLALIARWSYEYVSGREVIIRWRRPWPLLATAAVLAAWAYLLVYRREDDFAASWLGMMYRRG